MPTPCTVSFVRRETGNPPTHPFSLKATLCLFFPTLDTGGQQHPGLVLSFLEQGSHCPGAEARSEPWETGLHCRHKMQGAARFTAPLAHFEPHSVQPKKKREYCNDTNSLKLVYKFSIIPIKIPRNFNQQSNSEVMGKCQRNKNNQDKLEKK